VERGADAAAAYKVELALSELSSLSVLPSVAVQYLSKILHTPFSPACLAEIAEADPAVACRILSLSSQAAAWPSQYRCSIHRALDRLPAQLVRDALLAVRVLTAFEPDPAGGNLSHSRKDLLVHSLAVACCAGEIAQILPQPVDTEMAYAAGLLHDIGKLALQEIMPKGFSQIVDRAQSSSQNSCSVELERLGIDHTVIGKELAQRWQLPEAISFAIWLHHSDTAVISEHIPRMKLAQVVQSADFIARKLDLGRSGSFDAPEPLGTIAESLGVDLTALEEICGRLPDAVKKRAEVLHLDMPNASAKYCDVVQSAAAEFAAKQTQLSTENRTLQLGLNHLGWVSEFLLTINSNTRSIELAGNLASRWQKVYQTGTVCLYLVPDDSAQVVEAVVVEALGHTAKVTIERPSDSVLVPTAIANKLSVMDAGDELNWLFEQLEVDFNLNLTKLVPLLCNGRAAGVIVFEVHYPGDSELFAQKFSASAAVAGVALGIVSKRQQQERLAERFVRLVRRTKEVQHPPASSDTRLEAVAEMAAGVAHELNNPLSVISGRAQLLAKGERNEEKRESLLQIQQNVTDASGIVDELMSFAQPDESHLAQTAVRQIVDEAIELAGRKTGTAHLNVQLRIEKEVTNVFVDSAQIASAIANVITNSIESYTDTQGPVTVTAQPDASGEGVKLLISDMGCGMDADTLRKASYPFFSAKPAGRKRGMGLAYASRLIQLNHGSLRIISEPGKGTTVTVLLPTRPPT